MKSTVTNMMKRVSIRPSLNQSTKIPFINGRTAQEILFNLRTALIKHRTTLDDILAQYESLKTHVSDPPTKADIAAAKALMPLVEDLHKKLGQLVLDLANAGLEIEDHMGKYMIYYEKEVLDKIYDELKDLSDDVGESRLDTWGLQQLIEDKFGFPKSS